MKQTRGLFCTCLLSIMTTLLLRANDLSFLRETELIQLQLIFLIKNSCENLMIHKRIAFENVHIQLLKERLQTGTFF